MAPIDYDRARAVTEALEERLVDTLRGDPVSRRTVLGGPIRHSRRARMNSFQSPRFRVRAGRLELKKYNPVLRKHTLHRETK